MKLIAEQLSSANKELNLYTMIDASVLWLTAETVNMSLEREHAQPPLIARRIGQLLKLIRQRHTSAGCVLPIC